MTNTKIKFEDIYQNLDGLYEKDPEKFEAIRRRLLDQAISEFPEKFQHRARGGQFVLDCELRKYKNPVARMNRMVELFWEKVYEFQDTVNNPEDHIQRREKIKKAGKVIQLF